MKKSNKLDNKNGLTSTYIVTANQTIYDVAIDVHGTIDGISDLLINNAWLNIDTELYHGMKIIYTSGETIEKDIVSQLDASEQIPVNPIRKIYPKENVNGKIIDIFTDAETLIFSCIKNIDSGDIYIDWGDNTDIEKISGTSKLIYHQFEATDDDNIERKIRFFIQDDKKLNLNFDSNNHYEVMVYQNININEYRDLSRLVDVRFLRLAQGLQKLDLPNVSVLDITPISMIETLRDIKLTSKKISPSTLDDFFISIIENYGNRLPATIEVDVKPNGEYKEPDTRAGVNFIKIPSLHNGSEPKKEFKYEVDGRIIQESDDFLVASLYRKVTSTEKEDYFYTNARFEAYSKDGELLYSEENINTGGAYSRAYSPAYNSYNYIEKIDEIRTWYSFNFPKDLDPMAEKFYVVFYGDSLGHARDAQIESGYEPTDFNDISVDESKNLSRYKPKNGMEAVWVLTNEPEWNSDYYKWEIIIEGINYQEVEK